MKPIKFNKHHIKLEKNPTIQNLYIGLVIYLKGFSPKFSIHFFVTFFTRLFRMKTASITRTSTQILSHNHPKSLTNDE